MILVVFFSIKDFLSELDGCGLILTDYDLIEEKLMEYGLSLDSIVRIP